MYKQRQLNKCLRFYLFEQHTDLIDWKSKLQFNGGSQLDVNTSLILMPGDLSSPPCKAKTLWNPHGCQWPGGTKIVQTTKLLPRVFSRGKKPPYLTAMPNTQICLHIDELSLSGRSRKNVKSHEQFHKSLFRKWLVIWTHLTTGHVYIGIDQRIMFTSSAYWSSYQNKAITTLYFLKPCFGLQK